MVSVVRQAFAEYAVIHTGSLRNHSRTQLHGITAAAKHLQPRLRIIGVQAERAPAYYMSWKHGVAISTETCDTIADGHATRIPIEENITAIRERVDDVRLVTEGQMLDAIAHLLQNEGAGVKPTGD
jgi:threonine dehydratase